MGKHHLRYNMKKFDKAILLFYGMLAVVYFSSIIYVSDSLGVSEIPDLTPQAIEQLTISKTADVDRKKLFDVMTDVENYPKVLPRNIISIKIIEKSDSQIIAEEEMIESGIRTKLLIKHEIYPYEKHIIEVLDGDAKGTIIIQSFSGDEKTTIDTEIKLKLHGLLTPFGFLAEPSIRNIIDFATNNFISYAIGFDDPYEKLVDEIYREILLRPVDPDGLQHYSSLLRNEKITVDELREELLNSEEWNTLQNTIP